MNVSVSMERIKKPITGRSVKTSSKSHTTPSVGQEHFIGTFPEDEKVTAPRWLRSGNEWEDLADGSPYVIFPVPLR